MSDVRPTLRAERNDVSEQEILDALTRILRDLLLDDSIVLTMTTRRDEVRDWDSLAYISFMVGVETEFSVKFGVAEIESFESVGAIVRRTRALVSAG
jgi:acyl carrier protein